MSEQSWKDQLKYRQIEFAEAHTAHRMLEWGKLDEEYRLQKREVNRAEWLMLLCYSALAFIEKQTKENHDELARRLEFCLMLGFSESPVEMAQELLAGFEVVVVKK
jgi:hypothetical protein